MLVALSIFAAAVLGLLYYLRRMMVFDDIPSIKVPLTKAETEDEISAEKYDPDKHKADGTIPCYDPATMQYLGTMPAMTADEVNSKVARAWKAAEEWKKSSFAKRKLALKIMLKYIVENQQTICRVSARDSGKPMVDAAFGEVIVTCEKICWLVNEGEKYLKPEKRSAGIMMFYKSPRVEYVPLGVIGAIVPWNYPFHNVLNPITAAIFAGNAIVIKVSEHASWSAKYYGAMISEALKAAGAPQDLVQIVTGYGEAGHALAASKLGKLIFVGSTGVGRAVMKTCVERLTPVTLELGGKDALVVCEDCDLKQVVQTSLRAAYQACGANCMGGERFIVQSSVYKAFVKEVVDLTKQLRQGPALGGGLVDCGAICLPGLPEKIHELVSDAIGKGAKVLAGGQLPDREGQFYPPTILTEVTSDMRIWKEEVFGPVMTIVEFETDADAVKMVNDCDFALGSNVFSKSSSRANEMASQIEAGMASINDYATTYMCQSLPFGGIKESGFDRFAGIEGLRALCCVKSISEDAAPWLMKTDIPPALQYPIKPESFEFVTGLVKMFYAPGLPLRISGLVTLAKCSLFPQKSKSE
ncbi:hypothetical protein BSKO_00904 [Bryopsis sp. KO-2023]|nr:hypothetical protein BSKO_00904 [Bryopsis sp. KO-2023]